jgi:hypothetical protein
MSERGTRLMVKADSQLSEMIEFFGTLDEADLRKSCPDESAEHSAGDTVGAVAAHMAEGYHHLGRFLQATGYVPGPPATGNNHGRDHGHAPEALPDIRDWLTGGKTPIGLLADLTDEQLDSRPPAGSSRFSDGRRTLEQVIDAAIAHQAAHLVTLKRAIA